MHPNFAFLFFLQVLDGHVSVGKSQEPMIYIKLISIDIEECDIIYSLYLSYFVEEGYSFAALLALLYFCCQILGNGKIFPHHYVWIETMQIKAILVDKKQPLSLVW